MLLLFNAPLFVWLFHITFAILVSYNLLPENGKIQVSSAFRDKWWLLRYADLQCLLPQYILRYTDLCSRTSFRRERNNQ